MNLWLIRHAGAPVAIAAASDRATACRLAHTLATDVPFCDFSAMVIGTPKQTNAVAIIADLRPRRAEVADATPHADARPPSTPTRRRVGHTPGPRAPSPALAAFSALCAEFGVAEDIARSSKTPVATRLRWAIWSACLGAGYNQRQAADVTGHDNGTVSHTMVGLASGKLRKWAEHPDTARACKFAVAALRAESTGPSVC